ncbi:MAG TPA: diacylglycerol kinase family protein [Streptosporangiaceae bacterium]|nr:diacylglycerol kinase family protein [Streptosporangiaceae bacterium]
MRALLVVNPHATSTTARRREVIARALRSELDLEVVQTRYRGHACQVSRAATESGYGLVVALGGDGTVNEAINGILSALTPPGAAVPALATVPGGNANVFSHALGLPADPVEATGQILTALAEGRRRKIGVGLAGDRYFCFNAGLGLDAEVVRAVEGMRTLGQSASAALYLSAAVRQFFLVTDRRHPALSVERDGQAEVADLFCGMVSNTSSWTYLGRRPVRASPQAGFDTGLDLLGLRKLSTFGTLNTVRQMLSERAAPVRGRYVVNLHDSSELVFRASRPVAFQVDGEYVGERECVTFRAIPHALQVVA